MIIIGCKEDSSVADVFISHSSVDKKIADYICEQLEKNGITCWIAPRDIAAGSDWAATISSALSDARAMLLIYSKNSSCSTQVPKELSIAEKKDTLVIPYKIDDTELTGSFEYYLTGAHWITVDPENGDYKLDEVTLLLSNVLGTPRNTPAEENTKKENNELTKTLLKQYIDTNKEASRALKHNLRILAAAFIVMILSALYLVFYVFSSNKTVDCTFYDAYFGTVSGSYKGELTKGKPDGYGTFTWSGDKKQLTYTGNWVNGSAEGTGTLTHVHSDGKKYVYEGTFINCKLNGTCKGKITSEDGSVKTLEGEFIDGQHNGKGHVEMVYGEDSEIANSVFDGSFVNGNAEGTGKRVRTYKNGDVITYEGEFTKGKANGKGTMTSELHNGDVRISEGDWKDDKATGYIHAVCTYSEKSDKSTSEYDGDFLNNNADGNGKTLVTFRNGDTRQYEGTYKAGSRNGTGRMEFLYADGEVKSRVYEGTFADDCVDGYGTEVITFANGNTMTYIGEFHDNEAEENKNELIVFDIDSLINSDGRWLNKKWNGQGRLECVYADGSEIQSEVFDANFVNGVMYGCGKKTSTLSDGEVISLEGIWNNGVFSE